MSIPRGANRSHPLADAPPPQRPGDPEPADLSSEARRATKREAPAGSCKQRLLFSAVLAAALPFAAAAAPMGGRAKGGGGPPVGMDDELAFSLIASLLTLSEAQQSRLRGVLQDASVDAGPLASRLDATHDGLFDAVKAGDGDAELARLAAEQGALQARLLALQAQAFARLWDNLTPGQKASVEPRIFGYIGELLGGAAGRSTASP